MTVDLDRQLREYCQHLDETQGSLSFEDILERTGELQVIPGRGNQHPSSRRRWIAAAAAALAILLTGIGVRVLNTVDVTPQPADQPTTTSIPSTATVPVPMVETLPALRLPGMSSDEPAGQYGWTGEPGSRGWMHRVIEGPAGVFRQTQLAFTVEDDCFARSSGEPTAVTVAGLDGVYLEPYDDDSEYWITSNPGGGETTAAYALPIDDRTLCAYLRWDAATTPDELSAAREVVESIRGEPYGEEGIRINFTLPAGWDTG